MMVFISSYFKRHKIVFTKQIIKHIKGKMENVNKNNYSVPHHSFSDRSCILNLASAILLEIRAKNGVDKRNVFWGNAITDQAVLSNVSRMVFEMLLLL